MRSICVVVCMPAPKYNSIREVPNKSHHAPTHMRVKAAHAIFLAHRVTFRTHSSYSRQTPPVERTTRRAVNSPSIVCMFAKKNKSSEDEKQFISMLNIRKTMGHSLYARILWLRESIATVCARSLTHGLRLNARKTTLDCFAGSDWWMMDTFFAGLSWAGQAKKN